MRTSMLSLAVLLTAGTANAQVSDWINADPEELRALKRKTLVVEIPQENPKVIEGFNKKTAAEQTAAYRASLEAYRQVIEPAVRAHWTYNENIEFKTTSEIIELFEKESSKYVALMKVVLPDGGGVAGYTFGMGVPALMLTRTDGKRHKVNKKGELFINDHDFQSYLVMSPTEDGAETYTEASMKLSLLLCQHYLVWNTKQKKSQTFMKYLKAMTEKNCSKSLSRELLVDETTIYKSTTKEEVKEEYGHPMTYLPRAELEAAYLEGSQEKAALFSIPVGTIKGSMVVVTITRYVYSKVVVDPATSEVLNAVVPGMGKSYAEGLMPMDMRDLKECK